MQKLEAWLNTRGLRQRRRFLEENIDLLAPRCETALSQLIAQFKGDQTKVEVLEESQFLIQDARARGATRDSVRDAYVNVYGGQALDAPSWLEDIERQVELLLSSSEAQATIDARVGLLRNALSQLADESSPLPELSAGIMHRLEITLREIVDQRRPHAVDERVALLRAILQIYASTRYPRIHANMLLNLGATYYDRISGNRSDNLEQAILCDHQALLYFTETLFPLEYSHAMNNLGNALVARVMGSPHENVEEAITCFHSALKVRTRASFPMAYAQSMHNLGNAYMARIAGNLADNLEEAIRCYREALQVRPRATAPTDFAETMMNLGSAYAKRVVGERVSNLNESIRCYREALNVYTLERSPYFYASIMNNLGNTYRLYAESSNGDHLDDAIVCFRSALRIQTADTFPLDYARVMENLGLAYCTRKEDRRGSITEAVASFREALRIYPRDSSSKDYARLMQLLGTALSDSFAQPSGEDIEEAISCFNAALQIYTVEVFPQEFAKTKANLARAFLARVIGDRADNLEDANTCICEALGILAHDKSSADYARVAYIQADILVARLRGERRANVESAIHYYREALGTFTRESWPQMHAEIVCSLGHAFKGRIEGVRLKNLEQAIACYQEALRIRTQEAFQIEWASTQTFLGEAYQALINVAQSDSIQVECQAHGIECFTAALTVFTRGTYPALWAYNMRALGETYASPVRSHEIENVNNAFISFSQALTVYTRGSYPLEWAYTQHGLGQSYMNGRNLGSMGDNVDQAIACYEAALQVLTREAYPHDWANLQYSLGAAYSLSIHSNVDDRLERAIACYQGALQIMDRTNFPRSHSNLLRMLGTAFLSRQMGNRAENVEQGMAFCQSALDSIARQDAPFEWARAQESLGDAYRVRVHGIRDENLERAIACHVAAMEVFTREAFPFEWAKQRHLLGDVYLEQSTGREGSNIERAIACYKDDLAVRTPGTASVVWALTQRKLGIAYALRRQGNRSENLNSSAACYSHALQIFTPEAFPTDHCATALDAAFIEMDRANWPAADTLLTSAQQSESQLLKLAIGIREQDAVLMRAHDAATLHAYVLTKLGRSKDALLAIERGRARTLASSRALDAADPSLISDLDRRERYVRVREKLIGAQRDVNLSTLDTLSAQEGQVVEVYLSRVDALHEIEAEFQGIISEIRSAHDPENFLVEDIDMETLWRAARLGGPGHGLIYLLATPMGGIAIAALCADGATGLPDRCETLNIPSLSRALLYELTEGETLLAPQRSVGGFALAQSGRSLEHVLSTWQGPTLAAKAAALHEECKANGILSTLDTALQAILQSPAVLSLSTQPLDVLTPDQRATLEATLDFAFLRLELLASMRVLSSPMHILAQWLHRQQVRSTTLIPCGQLAAFPLLSVPIDLASSEMPPPEKWRTFSDSLPSSVAPSARSLLSPKRGNKPRTGVYTLGNPQWSSQPLPWGEAEALTVVKLAKRAGLTAKAQIQDDATRTWLIDVLQKAQIADVSCHGAFDPVDVLRSRLFLAGGESLMLGNILGRESDLAGLRLLILSACQTANLDLYGATDEVHSLAAGMLQAGAAAVLGALWSVDDKATYLLMVRFAQEWFPCMTHEPPAAALARAQRWLRGVTNRELREWQAAELRQGGGTVQQPEPNDGLVIVRGRGSRYSVGEAQDIMRQSARRLADEDCPYDDPFYWAAFQLTGW